MVVVLIASLLLVRPAIAAAQEGADEPPITWGIRPSSATGPDGRNAFEYLLDPGASVEDYVGVSNFTDRPLELDVYATDAFTNPDGHFDLLPAADRPGDVGAWIAFADGTVTVPPRSRLDIPFRLTVPERATPGDHPGGIVASLSTVATDDAGNPFSVDRRVGARVYLEVAGDRIPAAAVSDVAAHYDGSANPAATGEAVVAYSITNTGNVRIAGVPLVEVAGPIGLGRRRTEGAPIVELLPGDTLVFTARLPSVLPLGRLDATVRFVPQVVGGHDDDGDLAVRGGATAWAIPWSQLATALALAVGVVVLRRLLRGRRRALAARLDAARSAGWDEALATTTPVGPSVDRPT